MTTRNCVQCGHPLPENAKFCGQCGVVVQSSRPGGPSASRTLLAVPPAAAPPPPLFMAPAAKKTMVGLPNLTGQPPPPEATSPPATPARALGSAPARKTMLGVAMPGIAPLRAGESDNNLASTMPAQREAPSGEGPQIAAGGFGETLQMPAFFVPPPAPLPEPSAPSRPRPIRRRGAPLAVAALMAALVAILGGGAIALFWRSAPPIAAQPRIAVDGTDLLRLTCDPTSCKDGTVVSLHSAKATFAGGEAELPLTAPLHIGDNVLALSIDRPGMGRDETVKLIVPVAYRVRADLTTMETSHPGITIRVEAPPDSDVRIEDNPVKLDAAGAGAYVVDESAATEGPADESHVIAVDLPYAVTLHGRAPDTGTVSARVAVAPLRVDAPGTSAVIDEESVLIAGRAAKGANVTIDGAPVAVTPEGAFEGPAPIAALGDHSIEVRAATPLLAPRTVHVAVARVASLAEAARAFERRGPVGYDTAMRDIAAAKAGGLIIVEGDVVDARASGHRTLVLVDDRRGCAKGPCLARVVVGRNLTLAHGEALRAYGHVARAFRTPGAQTVPEVEAEFVLRATKR
jgi:hypothetical protein